MQKENGNESLLTSWKEIAAYLGCDQRTCARWEKAFGLPIHRLEGSPKSRVFAYREELEAWRREKLNGRPVAAGVQSAPHKWQSVKWAIVLPSALIGIVGLIYLLGIFRIDRKPADFRIVGSSLILTNEKGRELWRYDTGLGNLERETFYRMHFQTKLPNDKGLPEPLLPYLKIKDINADGKPEILFSTQTGDEFGEGDLLCFDAKGRRLWDFHAGRAMRYGESAFSPDYRIDALDTDDLDGDGRAEVLAICSHNNDFPTQLALLDCRGRVIGEYWNAGRMSEYAFSDINGDGRKEILISGVNNEYRKGFLMILDASRIDGGSPQLDQRYISANLKHGSELAYILFPRADLEVLRKPVGSIVEIAVLGDHRIQLLNSASLLYFLLGFDLKLSGIRISHGFEQARGEAVRIGELKGEADDAYFEALKRGLLYWTGRGWSSSAAWVSPVP
jgi:hypothetical protein